MQYTKAKERADQLIGALRFSGLKAEIAGGIWKGKPNPHDIDIVVEGSRLGSTIDLLSSCAFSVVKDIPDKERIPIEFYIVERDMFDRLLSALRAHRHEVIKGKMMSGLRFSKFTF